MSHLRLIACMAAATSLLALGGFVLTRDGEDRRIGWSERTREVALNLAIPSPTQGDDAEAVSAATPEPSPSAPTTGPDVAAMLNEFSRFDEELSQRLDVPSNWRPPACHNACEKDGVARTSFGSGSGHTTCRGEPLV